MRSVYWLFVVSALLFVSGIGFVVVASRADRRPAAAERPAPKPIATVKQIMTGITLPAATVVYDAVGEIISPAGTETRAPKTDKEWDAVAASAAALIESGNMLLVGGRAVDTGDWVAMSKAMIDAGTVALKAAEAKNADGVFASGEAINNSCDTCHQRYQRGS